MQKLTSSDSQLLRQCFSILNDVMLQIEITSSIGEQLLNLLRSYIVSENSDVTIIQAYKLLRLIIAKSVKIDIQQMYQFSRVQLLNTYNQQLRSQCQLICSLYLKNYSDKLDSKKQLIFYLSNIDCHIFEAQKSVLQIIEQYIYAMNKQQAQILGQLITMGICTAYTNQNQHKPLLNKILSIILNKIDNSKKYSLLSKAFILISKNNNNNIRVSGLHLAYQILNSMTKTLSPQQSSTLYKQLKHIISEQSQIYKNFQQQRKQRRIQKEVLKNEKQWKSIIVDKFQSQTFYIHPCFQMCFQLLTLFKQKYSKQLNIYETPQFLLQLWNLVPAPSQKIHLKILSFLQTILSNSSQNFTNTLHKTICNSLNPENFLQTFATELFQYQEKQIIVNNNYKLLFHLINNSLKNPKKFSSRIKTSLQCILFLLNYEKLNIVEETLKDILWIISKIDRNMQIGQQIKNISQKIAQNLRQNIGSFDYYRILSKVEQQKKIEKQQSKVKLAQLAVTDQQLYNKLKKKKKLF